MSKILYLNLLLFLFSFAACNEKVANSDNPNIEDGNNCDPYEEFSYTKYSSFVKNLSIKPYCEWVEVDWSNDTAITYFNSGKIAVINSYEELEHYLTYNDGVYPNIDLSKHTLLLARGITNNCIDDIVNTELQQVSIHQYKLEVEILLNNAFGVDFWAIAFITNKLCEESNIELNVIIDKGG